MSELTPGSLFRDGEMCSEQVQLLHTACIFQLFLIVHSDSQTQVKTLWNQNLTFVPRMLSTHKVWGQ